MSEQTAVRKRVLRRDAQRRREALLIAATSCFQESGYDVPLEAIADRAGVGRGTLYRNFRDREALALAIFSREIERFDELLDPSVPIEINLAALIREGASAQALFRRIATDLKDGDRILSAVQMLRDRLEQLLNPAVKRARERGEIDVTVSAADLVLVLQMVGGLLFFRLSEDEATDRINAALNLTMRGLRPR